MCTDRDIHPFELKNYHYCPGERSLLFWFFASLFKLGAFVGQTDGRARYTMRPPIGWPHNKVTNKVIMIVTVIIWTREPLVNVILLLYHGGSSLSPLSAFKFRFCSGSTLLFYYYYCCCCTVCTALLFSYSAIFIAASVRNKLIHSFRLFALY